MNRPDVSSPDVINILNYLQPPMTGVGVKEYAKFMMISEGLQAKNFGRKESGIDKEILSVSGFEYQK